MPSNKTRAEILFDIFENGLPAHYNSNQIRTHQVQMAFDAAAFLHPRQRDKKIMAIEAPVGTGKSLGALVPALVERSFEGFGRKQVVYATATINLQGQLMNSEVPLLKELKLVRRAVLAKGKSHYYCHKEMKNANLKSQDLIKNLTDFYSNSFTGQRDEFESSHGDISNSDWDRVNFKGSKKDCELCSWNQACPTLIQRSKFQLNENELLITNHEQLIQSALNQINYEPSPPIIPVTPGIIIIDEAHHFLENFLSRIERTLSISELQRIGNDKRFAPEIRLAYKEKIRNIITQLTRDIEDSENEQGRYPLQTWLITALNELIPLLKEALSYDVINNNKSNRSLKHKESHFSDRIDELLQSLYLLLDLEENTSWISYENSTMSSIPNNFPTHFRRMIEYLSNRNKIIVMSGTLTTNGDFKSFLSQWRLRNYEVEQKILPQSFHYEKQALIYVPQEVEDPRDQNQKWLNDQIYHYGMLINLTGGRTLILSTAKMHMQNISTPLQEICHKLDVTLLRQEQGGVEQLTQQFKADETSVLLGSGSFFSGFSITGSSLVSVVFTKLPFPVHDDPYLQLLGAGLEDTFMEDVLFPHMMIKLHQGAGRLIRDIKDYGIISILDPRVFTSVKYGALIRSDFERMGYRFTRSMEEIESFYRSKVVQGSDAFYDAYNKDAIVISDHLQETVIPDIKPEKQPRPKRPKTYPATDEQRSYAQGICMDRHTKLSGKQKTGEDIYKALVDIIYVSYENIEQIRSTFPYVNDAQRENLKDYMGSGQRTYKAKSCTDPSFGCSGVCTPEYKQLIAERIQSCGGKLDYSFPGPNDAWCWLGIIPHTKNVEIMSACRTLTEAAAGVED